MTAAGAGASAPWEDGASYEALMGRWSRILARRFLDWLHLPVDGEFLDIGCGTGAVTEALALGGARKVVGVDPSLAYVAQASRSVGRRHPQTTFERGDAAALRFPIGSFDAAVSGLVLNFVPDPLGAIREMRRVVRAKGIVAAYVWDYAGAMEMLRRFWDAVVEIDPAARALDEGVRFPLCNPGPLRSVFQDASLVDVETAGLDEVVVFRSFDEFWRPFLGGQGPSGAYTRTLPEERRIELRDRLRSSLRTNADGSIPMTLKAWAVRGQKG